MLSINQQNNVIPTCDIGRYNDAEPQAQCISKILEYW